MKKRYELIPIDLPLDFPRDRDIFLNFKLDARNISTPQTMALAGEAAVKFKLEHTDVTRKYIFIEGWAFLKGQPGPTETFVILQSDQDTYTFDSSLLYRRDVGKYFKTNELENTGFVSTIKAGDIKKGIYRIGLLVRQNDKQGFVLSKRAITVPKRKGRQGH